MNTNTGSFPTIGSEPEKPNHERSPDTPESEKAPDTGPPQPVREALPPDMEGSDPISATSLQVEEWDRADMTPIYLIDYEMPDLPAKQKEGSYLERVRFRLAVIVTVICLGTPAAMLIMRYPGDIVASATALLAAPLGLMLSYYFGRKLLSSKKKKKR